jgi:hypothetical protein
MITYVFLEDELAKGVCLLMLLRFGRRLKEFGVFYYSLPVAVADNNTGHQPQNCNKLALKSTFITMAIGQFGYCRLSHKPFVFFKRPHLWRCLYLKSSMQEVLVLV